MNERWHGEKPEEWVVFRPHYDFGGKGCLTNTSIRATSSACGLPSREKAEKLGRDTSKLQPWREDYLERLFGLPYSLLAHYDVRSCIYRTTYWLNTGEWLPEAVDFYPLMYAGLRPDDADSYDFETTEERAEFKEKCMRLYFCPSAADQLNRTPKELLYSWGENKEERLRNITEARRKMRYAVGGKTYGTEVFLHESCVLMMLRWELYLRGMETSQCYDGFWSDDPRLAAACEELLPVVAEEYQRKWLRS